MLASQVPLNFQPFASNPRPAGAPPYERLLLISSRVNDPMRVAAAALPNVAVVVYDWKNFTFQELVRYIKKAIGTAKVTSLAVIAPGNKPGCVGELGVSCARLGFQCMDVHDIATTAFQHVYAIGNCTEILFHGCSTSGGLVHHTGEAG